MILARILVFNSLLSGSRNLPIVAHCAGNVNRSRQSPLIGTPPPSILLANRARFAGQPVLNSQSGDSSGVAALCLDSALAVPDLSSRLSFFFSQAVKAPH